MDGEWVDGEWVASGGIGLLLVVLVIVGIAVFAFRGRNA
jgi:hypothetical protein